MFNHIFYESSFYKHVVFLGYHVYTVYICGFRLTADSNSVFLRQQVTREGTDGDLG